MVSGQTPAVGRRDEVDRVRKVTRSETSTARPPPGGKGNLAVEFFWGLDDPGSADGVRRESREFEAKKRRFGVKTG